MSKTVRKLDYHRNGVCGAGFHVAIVEDTDDGEPRQMVVVRFGEHADKGAGAVCCAAFDIALLAQGNIRFTENSWRGDHFAPVVDKAIAERESGSSVESR